MKQLKPGDLVKCYGHSWYLSFKCEKPKYGTVVAIEDDFVQVNTEVYGICFFHRKQVRLLTKKKVKPITRDELIAAYHNCTKHDLYTARVFVEELERIIGRKIK